MNKCSIILLFLLMIQETWAGYQDDCMGLASEDPATARHTQIMVANYKSGTISVIHNDKKIQDIDVGSYPTHLTVPLQI